MNTDILLSVWLDDGGPGMLICLVLFAALCIDLLVRHLHKPRWSSMSGKACRKAKKNRLKSAPRPWLVAVSSLLLVYTVFCSLPYFRDLSVPQPETVSAELVTLHRKHINNRTRYYVCTVQSESVDIQLKLSPAQTDAIKPVEGHSYAFTYFPHSRVICEIHPLP